MNKPKKIVKKYAYHKTSENILTWHSRIKLSQESMLFHLWEKERPHFWSLLNYTILWISLSFHVMALFWFLNFHNIVTFQVKRKYLQWQPASILLNTPMYSFSTWKNLLSPSVHQAFSFLVYDLGPDGTDICIGKSLFSPHREH